MAIIPAGTSAGTRGAVTPQIEAAVRAIVAAHKGWISPTPTIDWGQASAAAKTPGYIDSTFTAGGRGLGGTSAARGGGGAAASTDPYSAILKLLGAVPSLASLPGLAQRQALSAINPQLAGLDIDSQLQQSQLQGQQTRASEFANALAQMNIQAGNQVYGNYADAAKTFGALGQGLTGAVGQDWQAQADKVNAATDQMTGGRGGTIQGYDPASMANTQGTANVALPAANLAEQALRAGALTRAGIAANVGTIVDIANQYGVKLSDAQAQLVADKAKLRLEEPGLVQTALDKLKSARTDQIGDLAKILQARQTNQTNQATLKQRQTTADRNWQIQQFNAKTAAQKVQTAQDTADAYNKYLSGKTTLSTADQEWKQKYEANRANTSRMSAITQRMGVQLRQLGVLGYDKKGNIATGFYRNPLTNTVEKQPPNTYIGKDGMPHKLAGTAGTKTPHPPGTSVKDLHESMSKGLTDQWHIFDTDILGSLQARPHTNAEISSFLMRNFGNAYIDQYPELAATVKNQVAAITRAAAGWLKTSAANRKRNAALAKQALADAGTGGPTG